MLSSILPKNEQKQLWLEVPYCSKVEFFVRFLGEFKIPKRHFEIIRPLVMTHQFMLKYVCVEMLHDFVYLIWGIYARFGSWLTLRNSFFHKIYLEVTSFSSDTAISSLFSRATTPWFSGIGFWSKLSIVSRLFSSNPLPWIW